jgi:hypothetical protein
MTWPYLADVAHFKRESKQAGKSRSVKVTLDGLMVCGENPDLLHPNTRTDSPPSHDAAMVGVEAANAPRRC